MRRRGARPHRAPRRFLRPPSSPADRAPPRGSPLRGRGPGRGGGGGATGAGGGPAARRGGGSAPLPRGPASAVYRVLARRGPVLRGTPRVLGGGGTTVWGASPGHNEP